MTEVPPDQSGGTSVNPQVESDQGELVWRVRSDIAALLHRLCGSDMTKYHFGSDIVLTVPLVAEKYARRVSFERPVGSD